MEATKRIELIGSDSRGWTVTVDLVPFRTFKTRAEAMELYRALAGEHHAREFHS